MSPSGDGSASSETLKLELIVAKIVKRVDKMRRAKPNELNEDAKPIALLQLSVDRFRELFPVEFSDVDPLAAPEPSIGSLVQLDSGAYAVVMYGKSTGNTEVSMPLNASWAAFLREVPLIANEIVWIAETSH